LQNVVHGWITFKNCEINECLIRKFINPYEILTGGLTIGKGKIDYITMGLVKGTDASLRILLKKSNNLLKFFFARSHSASLSIQLFSYANICIFDQSKVWRKKACCLSPVLHYKLRRNSRFGFAIKA